MGWEPAVGRASCCALFCVLGAMTGFSEAGRRVALRAKNHIIKWTDRTLAKAGSVSRARGHVRQSIGPSETLLNLRIPPGSIGPGSLRGRLSRDSVTRSRSSNGG